MSDLALFNFVLFLLFFDYQDGQKPQISQYFGFYFRFFIFLFTQPAGLLREALFLKLLQVLPKCPIKDFRTDIPVKTEKLSIKAAPLGNGLVKAKTGDDTTDAVYLNWYSEVYLPNAVTGGEPNP